LLLGRLGGRRLVVLQGRLHAYEGYGAAQLAFPVRVMQALGASTLIVSNVSGGMHPEWRVGELVLLADHINLQGDNPLVGGPATDLGAAYDAELRALARTVAREQGVMLREGIYVAVQGPNLETRAEYRMLRLMGADVVGMSTVPEVIVARHLGLRVLGLSIITDLCLPETLAPASVEQIIAAARRAEPGLAGVVRGVVERLN
jgi:purine-nucleoside phosphorylase